MAELAEDACAKVLDKEFIDIFTLLAQDLIVSKVVSELNVEKVECHMYQGYKVGISVAGELTRSKDKEIVSTLPECTDLMIKLQNMVKHFDSNHFYRKKNYELGFAVILTSSHQ